MAKITGGLLSLGAGGTIGKTITFSKWKGQPYARQRVIPANPQTAEQTLTRGAFAFGSGVWKNAGSLLIAPWDRFAQGQKLTGRNAFIGSFVAAVRGEIDLEAMIFSPGAKGGPAAVSAIATPGSNQLSVAITPPTPPTGWTVTQCIAAVILDQDPASGTDYATVEGSDATDPYAVVLTGLTASVQYDGGAWVQYLKPDGTIAYGPSIAFTGTPTV